MKEQNSSLSDRTQTIIYRATWIVVATIVFLGALSSKSAWEVMLDDFKEIHTKKEAVKAHNLEVAEDIRSTVNEILTNLKKGKQNEQ